MPKAYGRAKNYPTRYGHGRGRGTYRGKPSTAATTIQRAYRNRKQFRKNLQPFVETKDDVRGQTITLKKDDGTDLAPDSAFRIYTPDAFLYKHQGVEDNQMVGDSVYSRYLTTKMLIHFPQGYQQILIPTQLWVYQVWITRPLNATPFTSPSSPAGQRDTVTPAHLEDWIKSQAREFFESKGDRMNFNEKMTGVQVIKKVRIKPNRPRAIGLGSGSYGNTTGAHEAASTSNPVPGYITTEETMTGGPPDVFKTFSWDVKGKEHYQKSSALSTGGSHYLNEPRRGYPALIIFNPDFAGQTYASAGDPLVITDRRIVIDFNSKHWFGDQ